MREERGKCEWLAIAEEKKKEDLDAIISQHGGLWQSEDDLTCNVTELNEKEKKIAIPAQIKYTKVVLGTKVHDKKLLQLSSNWKDYSAEELEQNLWSILRNLNTENAACSSSVYREVDERIELIDQYVAKKRKAVNLGAEDQQEKAQRCDYPELVGKCIYHKWVKGDTEEWINGNVLKVAGDVNNDNCKFEVKYKDEQEPHIIKLYEDLKNGDLTIISRCLQRWNIA